MSIKPFVHRTEARSYHCLADFAPNLKLEPRYFLTHVSDLDFEMKGNPCLIRNQDTWSVEFCGSWSKLLATIGRNPSKLSDLHSG